MQITITGRHFEMSDAIRLYATEKTEKLQRFFDGITKVDILLKGEDRTFHCEIILHINNNPDIVIDVTHESMYAAVDLATDKAQRQLKRHKEKIKNHHHHPDHQPPMPTEINDDDDDDDDYDEEIEE